MRQSGLITPITKFSSKPAPTENGFPHSVTRNARCRVVVSETTFSKSGCTGISISIGFRCSLFAWRYCSRPFRKCWGPKRTTSSLLQAVYNRRAIASPAFDPKGVPAFAGCDFIQRPSVVPGGRGGYRLNISRRIMRSDVAFNRPTEQDPRPGHTALRARPHYLSCTILVLRQVFRYVFVMSFE